MRCPFKHKVGLVLAPLMSLVVLGACGSGDDEAQQTPGDLWGRTFVSTAVTEDGEPRPLVPDTRIEVTFEEREDQGVVGWQAGCNTFGSDVEITADSVVVGVIAGTEIGCADELHAQDEWLAGFFGPDPRWQLSDDRLMLRSGETTIELEASRG
jgi:heat shock protein HslJ